MEELKNLLEQKVENVKLDMISSLDFSVKQMESVISADLANLELAILYLHKIYGDDTYKVQEVFNNVSDNIDLILYKQRRELFTAINKIIDNISSNPVLLEILESSAKNQTK